jgi:hypothetical protein
MRSFIICGFLPDIIMMNRLGRMKSVGHVGYMGEIGNVYRILVQGPEGKDY